ncbi:MAG TPA: hypothetical protein VJB57_05465 [Dehalococcoidia bacterium]|nr:hypothetical protein [Dehalococcoidia bacterium]
MNDSLSNPASGSTWKRTRMHYLAAAAGLALSVSALAALGNTGSSTQPTSSVTRPLAASSAGAARGSSSEIAFYLVASQAQADKVREIEELAQWVRLDSGVLEPNRSVMILDAATASDEARSRNLINDSMAASNFLSANAAPSFRVVDMRAQ